MKPPGRNPGRNRPGLGLAKPPVVSSTGVTAQATILDPGGRGHDHLMLQTAAI